MGSGHNTRKLDYDTYESGAAILDDPFAIGKTEIVLSSKSGGTLTLDTAGARTLPETHRGVSVYVFANASVTLQDRSGNNVADLVSGEAVQVVSYGDGTWLATTISPREFPPASGAALQDRISSDKEYARPIQLRAGATVLTETLNINNGVGGKIEGFGASYRANDHYLRQESWLEYTGLKNATQAAIQYERTNVALRDFGIFGDTRDKILAGAHTNAPVGIKLVRATSPYEGAGTGKICAENIVIHNCDVGLQIGGAQAEANCDESLWQYMTFFDCPVAMSNVNSQGMGHFFLHPHFHGCPVCFEMLSGGDLKSYGGLVAAPGTFLMFRNDETDGFGANNAGYMIQGLKIDNAAAGLKVVEMETVAGALYEAFINAWQIHFPNAAWGGPAFVLSGNVVLNCQGCINLRSSFFRWNTSGAAKARIIIENCFFLDGVEEAADALDAGNSTGNVHVTFRNNYNLATLAPMATFSDTVAGTA